MSFKEELQRKQLSSHLSFLEKNNFYLNRVDIHVTYVKVFLLKRIFEDTHE